MPEFRTVCRLDQLKPGEGKTVIVNDKLIAVFLDETGCHAIDDTCPHMGASLAGGHLENGIVTCPWHAWRFRVADGAWADNPRVKTPAYQVRIVEGEIQVEVSEPKPNTTHGGVP